MLDNNLADLDDVGTNSVRDTTNNVSSDPVLRKPTNVKKFFLGCFGVIVILFVLLIIAMVFGLAAGEDAIKSFGFDPASFKNITLGLVNVIFSTFSLIAVVVLTIQILKYIFASPTDVLTKRHSIRVVIFSGLLFIIFLITWNIVYSYLNRFRAEASSVAENIITTPVNTFSLVSPVYINFSAANITAIYIHNYDLVSYEWDREGDGIIDATGEKVRLYFQDGGKNNGVYNVILRIKLQPRVSGDATTQASQKALITKEYQRMVSISKQEIYGEILTNSESGEPPFEVHLDASNILDPHGATIINYAWDIDDDGQIDLDGVGYKRVVNTFKTIGQHTVTLTVTSNDFVTDSTHEQKTFRKIIMVKESSDMVNNTATIIATPKSGTAPLAVNLDASQSEIGQQKVDRYEWVIGDGSNKLYGVKARYEFKKAGRYPVTLKMIFANGQIKIDTIEINVVDAMYAPKAVIATDPTVNSSYRAVIGPAPLTVNFDATKSTDKDNNIVSYEWDFDSDNKIDASGSTALHEYRDEGKYKVLLRITDADGSTSEANVDVLVGSELPLVDLGPSALSGPAPLIIDFDASGSRLPGKRIVTYEWNFNAGTNTHMQTFLSEKAQTSHVFDTIGEYLVRLTLHADDGSTATDTTKIIATYAPLKAVFAPSRTTGPAPLAITFDSSGSTGNIATYAWSFGDDTTSTKKSPMHIFERAGIYDVTLLIFDNQKNISQFTQRVMVN